MTEPSRFGAPVPTGRIEHHPDGYALAFERGLDYPAGHIWEVLTNRDKVAQWLGIVTPHWQLGKEYRLDMGGSAVTGTVLQMSPGASLQLTWEDPLGGESVVSWQVQQGPDGTVLLFHTHENGSDFLTEGAAGWQGILETFADVAAGREPVRQSPERWLGLRNAYAEEFDVSPTMGRLESGTQPPELEFERWYDAAARDAGSALERARAELLPGEEATVDITGQEGRARVAVRQPVHGGADEAAALLAGWHQALDAAAADLAGDPWNPSSRRMAALRDLYRGASGAG